ncbi:MAG: hypothetical protein ACI9UN_005287 [Granulosicoccus sp.]
MLLHADFSDADLTGAYLHDAQFLETVTFANTTCPTGVNSDTNGGNCNGELF